MVDIYISSSFTHYHSVNEKHHKHTINRHNIMKFYDMISRINFLIVKPAY
jgi:hypothetical protein